MALSWKTASFWLMTSFINLTLYGQSPVVTPCVGLTAVGYFGSEKIEVEFDRLSGIPQTEIPFDRWFYVKKITKSSDRLFSVAIFDFNNNVMYSKLCFEQKPVKDQDGFDEIHILVPPIKPNKNYQLVLSYLLNDDQLQEYFDLFIAIKHSQVSEYHKVINRIQNPVTPLPSLNEFQTFYATYLDSLFSTFELEASPDERNNLKNKIFNKIQNTTMNTSKGLILLRSIELNGFAQKNFNFETRAKNILLPVIGYVYYRKNADFNGFTPYVGVTINFRSYDTDIPLGYIKNNFINRLSAQVGMTLGSVAKANDRGDLLGSRNLLLGFGYSFSHAIKLNTGVLLYNKLDKNPLIDDPKLAFVPYLGFSVDIRINKLISDLSSIFSGSFLPITR
jgi:hypothetical protein